MKTKFAANFVASAASATELFLLSAAQGLRRSGVPRACAHVRRRGSVNFSGSRRRRLVDCSVGLGSWVVGSWDQHQGRPCSVGRRGSRPGPPNGRGPLSCTHVVCAC